MKAVVDRASAKAGTSSQTRARPGPPGREIREYVVLSNPHCPESVGYWCGFFPKVPGRSVQPQTEAGCAYEAG